MISNSCSSAEIDEQRWMCRIHRMLEEVEDVDNDIPVSIFSVPRTLRAIDPDSYTPQLVAIGPYHCNRPHLVEMERYKLLSAKRSLKSIKFETLVEQLRMLDSKIRASYHKHLGFSSEMLSWMMAIDAAFLLDSLRLLHSFDQKSPDNAILRDIGMLENQIPMLVLRKMLELELETIQVVDDSLQRMLVSLCNYLSPFQMVDPTPRIQASECAHVLDFLYRIVVPTIEQAVLEVSVEFQDDRGRNKDENERHPKLVRFLLRLNKGLAWFLRRLLLSRPMKIVLALPLLVFCNVPALMILKEPVENLFSENGHEQNLEAEARRLKDGYNAVPLVEEISIPSVVELSNSGITFVATEGGIDAINFNPSTNEFCLPTVTLDANSEVILRNLVAYEASSSSRPLVLARYTELMNGIIDCKEDARLLREKGIILNHLKSDEEVATMWNGMSKSLRLTKVSFLDRAIEDVNAYYSRSWTANIGKFMKAQHVSSSWQVLTLLAVVLFLFLVILQVFSSLFNSTRRNGSRAS